MDKSPLDLKLLSITFALAWLLDGGCQLLFRARVEKNVFLV
jgi:hypothetical protein